MYSEFSTQVRAILSFGSEEALRLGDPVLDTEHLLLGLIREGDNRVTRILINANIDLRQVQREAETAFQKDYSKAPVNWRLPLSRQAEKVIERTQREARSLKSPTIEPEHLMLALLRNRKTKAARILRLFHIDYDQFRERVTP